MKIEVKNLTLEQKIGQLIIAGFETSYVNEDLYELIKKYHVGNIILFQKNIEDSDQLGLLNRDIQNHMERFNHIPAFIGIDQEGGMVTRLFTKATHFPGNMAVSAGASYKETYEIGARMGEELHSVGINVNFAPVLDVNSNPKNPVIGVRSYGDNPLKVAEYGENFFKGLQASKIVSFAKHFPGHGNTNIDTHFGLPTVESSLEELENMDLIPFVKVINSGIDGIMAAHIIFSELEENALPATLSRSVLTGLLRETLAFKGLIITDCLEMKAIMNNFTVDDMVVKALMAGADILCLSHTREIQIGALVAIKKAVEDGVLSMELIDRKVQRILYFKEKYEVCNWQKLSGNISEEQLKIDRNLATTISEKSITLIKDEKQILPLDADGLITIAPIAQVTTIADDDIEKANLACVVKEKIGGGYINYNIKDIDEQKIITYIKDKKTIVFGCYNMNLDKSQKSLLDKLILTGKDIILVALRNPYDISDYKNKVSTILCSYEYTKLSVNSIVKVLKGEVVAQGNLPVKI